MFNPFLVQFLQNNFCQCRKLPKKRLIRAYIKEYENIYYTQSSIRKDHHHRVACVAGRWPQYCVFRSACFALSSVSWCPFSTCQVHLSIVSLVFL